MTLPRLHCLLTVLWGLATPALMGGGASLFLESGASVPGYAERPAPLEFYAWFLVIGVLCLLLFLIYDLVVSVILLPKDGQRARKFLLALLFYILAAVISGVILAALAAAVRRLLS